MPYQSMLNILGIVLWVIAASVPVVWGWQIREWVKDGTGVTHMTVTQAMLFMVSVLVIPIFSLSPFHLLWMFPVSWLLGTLSKIFPFYFLWFPGFLFRHLCCLGLKRKFLISFQYLNLGNSVSI